MRVQKSMWRVFAAVIFISLFTACARKEVKIVSVLETGVIVADEVSFVNKSGMELTEVNVTLELYGEKGEVKKHERYWATWADGATKTVELAKLKGESVSSIQKYVLTGSCDQGPISYTATPPPME